MHVETYADQNGFYFLVDPVGVEIYVVYVSI